MLKTYDFHSFIQHPHFSQIAENLFRASFFTPADIAPYPGLGWIQIYFVVDYECIIWLSCKSTYNQKLAYKRPKTTFLLKKSLWKMR